MHTGHGPVRLPLSPVALVALAGAARAAAAVQEQPLGMPRSAAIPRDFHPLAAYEGLKATRHSTPAEKNQKPSTCSLNLQGRDET